MVLMKNKTTKADIAYKWLVFSFGESALHRELSHRLPEIYDASANVCDDPVENMASAIFNNTGDWELSHYVAWTIKHSWDMESNEE
jgi:hypothetical protein